MATAEFARGDASNLNGLRAFQHSTRYLFKHASTHSHHDPSYMEHFISQMVVQTSITTERLSSCRYPLVVERSFRAREDGLAAQAQGESMDHDRHWLKIREHMVHDRHWLKIREHMVHDRYWLKIREHRICDQCRSPPRLASGSGRNNGSSIDYLYWEALYKWWMPEMLDP
ncbi:hypothetical protein BKA93DRAFT_803795 [Sparassis latifolia]